MAENVTEEDFIAASKLAEESTFTDKDNRPDWWPDDYGHWDDIIGRWVEPDMDGDGEEDNLPAPDPASADWEDRMKGVSSDVPDTAEYDESDLPAPDPATADWEERMKTVTS